MQPLTLNTAPTTTNHITLCCVHAFILPAWTLEAPESKTTPFTSATESISINKLKEQENLTVLKDIVHLLSGKALSHTNV